MTRSHLRHADTARSAALMPGEPCGMPCKACEVEYRAERRTLIRRHADSAQAGVIRGEVSRFAGEIVEAKR